MRLPKGIVNASDRAKYILKLKKNLYGQKQAAMVWNEHLKQRLFKIDV